MTNILEQICAYTRERIEKQKQIAPQIVETARNMPVGNFGFEKALRRDDGEIAFICEVKKASPSKGVICEDFDHVEIAKSYVQSGASAISVLTEPKWFQGADSYLREIADVCSGVCSSGVCNTPLLRKDFTVDEYMIYEAKTLGADAVLLICSVLSGEQIAQYIKIADSLGLSSLVETHDESEIETALRAGARVIGVNNRNLKTFEMDLGLSVRLRKLVPQEITFVAESGIKNREDVALLREAGVNAVLIGETLMRGGSLSCLK
jgi:indole-3-glycerol phosphate synthase